MSSTDVTPAALGKLPIALTLPDELWIKILLQLDYATLKKASRICKGLQVFIKDKEFDSILFRTGPPNPATPRGKPVSLHLMIEKTEGIFASLNEAKIIDFETFGKNCYPKDYPIVLDEFATHPASSHVEIFMPDAPGQYLHRLSKATGITVRDFLEHLGMFWSTRAPKTPAAYYGMAEYGIESLRDVKYMHILGAHYVWTSWMGGVAQGGNRTTVTAGPFDS